MLERQLQILKSGANGRTWWALIAGCELMPLYTWLIKRLTRLGLGRLKRGDPRWILAVMADDVHFRFLGQHSWAADFHSKAKARAWLERYVEVGLNLEPLEIVVSGPPWRTLVCTRFIDSATDAGGNIVYRNEGVLFDRISWGRIREHISYEDTQRTITFDARLKSTETEGTTSSHDERASN